MQRSYKVQINIFLNDDLCAASQAIKTSQMPLLKEAKAQGKMAYFRYTKLIIRERKTESDVAGRGQQHPHVDAATVEDSRTDSEVGVRTENNSGAVAGVVDGGRARSGPGDTSAGDVVAVEAHGAWVSRGEEANFSLSSPRLSDSRERSPSVPGADADVSGRPEEEPESKHESYS